MDISHWPVDDIMKLPDHLFGRRWVVNLQLKETTVQGSRAISRLPLPDHAVIWQISIVHANDNESPIDYDLRIGPYLPAVWSEAYSWPKLIPQSGRTEPPEHYSFVEGANSTRIIFPRMYIAARSRHLVARMMTSEQYVGGLTVDVVVSSLPREVPDWFISGPARNQ